ncbi:MAG: hypothetical protein LBO06_06175 [Bacteroidales bacterium]|nr:hypothetical protein [Bacteroidales bacterium]
MKIKILSIDDAQSVLADNLIKAGFDFVLKPDYQREDLLREIATYQCLIVRSKILIDREIIDKATNLQVIARIGAGMDAIDVDYAEKKGITCLNSPEGNRDAVGEHTLGLLLCLFDRINRADCEVKSGLWRREANRGLEIKGKTIGIIGYGNMGKAFAQRLQGFECEIMAFDKYKTGFGDGFVKEVSLQTLFDEADVLSLHVPLTEETHFMVDDEFIERFGKPFFLLNTSRGKVLKTAALINGLQNGRILGAGLDVLEFEAFSSEISDLCSAPAELKTLFSADNVVLTPHIAGWSAESAYKLADILSQKVIKFFAAAD